MHIDALDGKAAFLIECNCGIVLRVYGQFQICAAEGSGKNPQLLHHLRTDSLTEGGFIHAEITDEHDLTGHSAGTLGIPDMENGIAHHNTCHLCDENRFLPDQLIQIFHAVGFIGIPEQIRTPVGMKPGYLTAQPIDILLREFGDVGNCRKVSKAVGDI